MNGFSLDIDLLPMNVAVYKKDAEDFIFIAFNKEAQKTENLDSKELIGKKLTKVFPGVKEFGLFDILIRVEKSGLSETFDTEFYKDNRVSGWRHNKVIKLEDGIVAAFYSDKNLEKELEEKGLKLEKQLSKTEKELEHQRNVFQNIMENSDAISVQGYNQNHEVIYWNRGSEYIYGYTREEALGKTVEELIIPLFMRNRVSKGIDDWIFNDVKIPSSELTLMDKYGNDVNVFSQHVMIEVDSQNKEMYCIDIDLKEIKRLEQDLAVEKNFLNTIFDIIPDLVWLKDIDGKYLKCNDKFELLYGLKESEIIGKTDFDFLDEKLALSIKEHDEFTINANKPTINEEDLKFSNHSDSAIFETIKITMKDNSDKIIGILGIARDISERKLREKELEKYANFDILTGLLNRNVFMYRLNQLITKRCSKNLSNALLFIDLDRFKEINDTLGHGTGDKLLILVSQRLKSVIRSEDTLARLGGDEFTILAENLNTYIEASYIAQKILNILTEPFMIDKHEIYISSSIGISIFPHDSNSAESLLKYADSAMYKAKDKGRNGYEYYTKELSEKAIERVSMVNDLRSAIKNREFELYYQLQMDVKMQKIKGAEALIRWNHPKNGLVSPFVFIPIAESSGQILEIGKWVIYQAMSDIVGWKRKGLDIEKLSVNLSVKQLNDKRLFSTIVQILEDTKCKPEWIEFEITESYTMNNPEETIVILNKLVALGFTLSMDDFGTGYSSLSYLKKLPIKKLKIDKSFIDDIERSSDDRDIVKIIVSMALSMNLEVIAEGVETQQQQDILLEYECNLTQGYLYSKPIPKKEFQAHLSKNKL